MMVVPKFHAVRLAALKPGDLFIYARQGLKCFALKGRLGALDGDECSLLLGPNLPKEHQLRAISAQSETVVAIGADYTIVLPFDPIDWASEEPTQGTPCIAIMNDKTFLRGNSALVDDRFSPCWFDVKTGIGQSQRPSTIGAYALKWKIKVGDSVLNEGLAVSLP
jgi:hypothetical protein